MKHLSTDLDRDNQEYADDETFTRTFWKDIAICQTIAVFGTVGILAVIVNADAIDSFMTQLIKSIFI